MGCCSCIAGCIKCGVDCLAKSVLMPLNGFFAVGGLIITIVAGIALAATDLIGISATQSFWVSTLCFGAVILITSALGCAGACCKNKCLLIPYIVLLVLLIIGQIVLVSMAGGISDDTKEELLDKLKDYNPTDDKPSLDVDPFVYQIDHECCGVYGFNDWKNNTYFAAKDASLPGSCCKNVTACGDAIRGFFNNPDPDLSIINEDGCFDKEIGFFGTILWGIMIAVIIVQGGLVVLAGCLTLKVGED